MIKRCGEEAVRIRGGYGHRAADSFRNPKPRSQGEQNRSVATERFQKRPGPLVIRPENICAELASADHHTTTSTDAHP